MPKEFFCSNNVCWNSRSNKSFWNNCSNSCCWNSHIRNFVPAIIVGTFVPTIIVGTPVPTIIVLTTYYWKSCVKGVQLLNLLPVQLRNSEHGDVEMFKNHLDIYLSIIPDQPTIGGLTRPAQTNSLLHKISLYENMN